MAEENPLLGSTDRASQLRKVLAEVLARRREGEQVPDHAVIERHPELMPELGDELRKLARVEEARRQAADGQATLSTDSIYSEEESIDAGMPASDSFPGYEIVREIHRGGQGVVYQAIQKATRRKVAIKILREGPFASHRERVRFEREVQVLGALKHPSIVAIHDSGLARNGQAFFVMDYISGQPLDVYMASRERSIEDTLQLFSKICEAVNSAHLRGVIHRDLKPSNIRIDSQSEPHILDFGLAKVAASDVTDASRPQVMTITGQFVGSLPWASPEQAIGQPDQVDTRTDVYSLGVILYQMLTGKFPYEVVGNMRDVLENILKVEPARPSTVRKQINDEVETIVLKSLSKERDRRYQTAGELGRDVERFLAGEAIEAKRDSTWYVLGKAIRRYKSAAGIGAAIVVGWTAFFVATITLWQKAESEREEAVEQKIAATIERDKAYAAERKARLERERAEREAKRALVAEKELIEGKSRLARVLAGSGELRDDAFKTSVPSIDWAGLGIVQNETYEPFEYGNLKLEAPPLVHESANFIVHSVNDRLSKVVAERAEVYLTWINEKLFAGRASTPRIPVLVYQDLDDYRRHGGILELNSGVMVVTEASPRFRSAMIMFQWTKKPESREKDDDVWRYAIESVLPHEIVHSVVMSYFGETQVPTWLHEALAGRFERTRNHRIEAVFMAFKVEDGEYFPLAKLFRMEKPPEEVDLFYKQTQTIVYFLSQLEPTAIQTFLAELADGRGHEAACAKVLNVSEEAAVEEFERRWMRWLTEELLPQKNLLDEETVEN